MALALEAADIGVQEIAEVLEVSRNTVSNYLHGRSRPNAATLRVWANRCSVDYGWLSTGQIPTEAEGGVTDTDIVWKTHNCVGQLTLLVAA